MELYNLVHITGENHELVIPDNVELKIRALCHHNADREWSGVLFYKPTGSFNSKLTITCVDICPMDIGTATYTEFNVSPKVVAYMAENDLLDCEMGLCHSHDHMGTFFSGTDQGTLKEEGSDRNVFVSLIVNNEGTYTAAVTRKVSYKSVKTCITHSDFNNSEVLTDSDSTEQAITEVEWHDLKVIAPFEALSKEIKAWTDTTLKAKQPAKTTFAGKTYKPNGAHAYGRQVPSFGGYAGGGYGYGGWYDDCALDDEELFAEEKATWKMPASMGTKSALRCGADMPDLTKIQEVVIRLLTGSLVADVKPDAKEKLKQWVKTKMVGAYNKFLEPKDRSQFFMGLADIVIGYYLPELYDAASDKDAIAIQDLLLKELEDYPNNELIQEIKDAIRTY